MKHSQTFIHYQKKKLGNLFIKVKIINICQLISVHFLNIFQASFQDKCTSTKEKMTGVCKEYLLDKLRYSYVLPYPGMYHQLVFLYLYCSRLYAFIKHSDEKKASMMLNNLKLDNIEPMVTIPVTEAEVRSIIKSLKSKGTSGYDGISSKILKQCASTVIKPLIYMCNLSLTTGTFPERCKPAIVRPI